MVYIHATELYTLKNGLLFALDAGFVPLFVETDCLNVVQLINNEEVCLAPEGSLVEEIRILRQVPSTVLSYIPRQANTLLILLHSLASMNEISHTGWNQVLLRFLVK
ncbi:unnamed protein product [Prunus armeniaca]|uniref:RNase H type-1 domain-containing protein n=1 Tax=Prunus armeniaca TaxID=36596 RepID=A0A6J5WVK2_PRUAR|nr:unnamed protein product [Prunus armeniaca]CAB4304067.1 unnamed protein product [Prunus armeniaca]